jgi:hypothetical protein
VVFLATKGSLINKGCNSNAIRKEILYSAEEILYSAELFGLGD